MQEEEGQKIQAYETPEDVKIRLAKKLINETRNSRKTNDDFFFEVREDDEEEGKKQEEDIEQKLK